MNKPEVDIRDLDELLCKYGVKDLEDLENRLKKVYELEEKLEEKEERINWLVEAEFNRKWAKKYVEMRRKEEPMLCLPDSDEVYEKYFELKQQLAESEKRIQEYEKIVEQKDEEISFANRDKTYIVKQLNDPKDYVSLEDYKKVDQKLTEKEKAFNWLHGKFANYVKANQDKISFTIKQLEKAISTVENVLDDALKNNSCNSSYYDKLLDLLDQQIKELKEILKNE